jgi:hypothetical protein
MQMSNNMIVCYVFLCEQLCYSEQYYSHILAEFVRGDVHIQVATQNVKLTFWVGGWVKTVVL